MSVDLVMECALSYVEACHAVFVITQRPDKGQKPAVQGQISSHYS